ncbi:MAG TPA: selenocysteine-specific translation elongation factor [Candidatus Udaeobacter sp.]|nr:selenocysteine-specific translation elongation factor [Candidatus Udaeobacter sp.]
MVSLTLGVKSAEKHFILATAGHVDHGKSALVKALTGTDPDRLPEEKKREITIDLGFAELNLAGPDEQRLHIGIVDVPGHVDFVRNMIAGVGSIDLALLAVAADDGWMPQTEEHLQILTYLGVERAVIALTKSDLGGIDTATRQIRDRLRDSPLADAQIVATSVRNGEGIETLKSALASEFATMRPPRDCGKPRLFIDRVFTLRGIGTVVTGTLTGGQLRREQKIVVQPGNLQTRIRSIQSHGRELEIAEPGMRTAISLPDVSVEQISRGNVVTIANFAPANSTLIALLEKSPRLPRENPGARPLKSGSSVYLHHGTSRIAAKIALRKNGILEPGKKEIAQLRLASPIFTFAGDHFVIRDPSEQHTLAGGMVLDPNDAEFRDETKRNLLMSRAMAPDNVHLWVRSEVGLRGFVPTRGLLDKSRFSNSEIADVLLSLKRDEKVVVHDKIAANTAGWKALRDRATRLIDNALSKNPERVGYDLSDLRAALWDKSTDVFEALMADMCSHDFIRKESTITRRSHRPALPARLQSVAATIHDALSKKPFDPPPRRELERDLEAQRVVRFLIENGKVIEISSDVVLLRENFERMKNAVADFISKNGPATVSELRQALESSRRIMVPFLERLDREGVTRRVGDKRTLGRIM